MPKIDWKAAGDDEVLTAEDIDQAEDGYAAYTGDLPSGGVYRFRLRRMKFKESSTEKQGLNALFELDGSWRPAHAAFDGCPLWDTVWMTKASASFAKAFAAALGVSGGDLVSGVVTDEDGVVTKIGRKKITEGMHFYILVKRGTYNGEERLERAGTGYQVVEGAAADKPASEEAPPKKGAKATAAAAPAATTKAKGGKGKKGAKPADDEPPF